LKNPDYNMISRLKLTGLEWNVGFAVYALKMVFTECESPQFGTDALSSGEKILPDEAITKVKIKATQLRIAAIVLKTSKNREIKLLGTN